MNDIIEHLIPIVEKEFPNAEVSMLDGLNTIKISQLTNDDERLSKRYQPILITLHDDFETSEFAKRPISEIGEDFFSFIRNEHAQFQPRTTDNHYQPHTEDKWVFPKEC